MSSIIKTLFWNFVIKIGAGIITQGIMPKHIAFIMDGNRRYAKKLTLSSVTEGHYFGYNTAESIIDMSEFIGIQEVTLYVLSIENFHRPQEEVEVILNLILKFCQKVDIYNEKGVCVEFIGQLTRLPENVQRSMAKMMMVTKTNTKIKLNFAVAYSARDEITRGLSSLVKCIGRDEVGADDVDEKILYESFRLHNSRPLDLLIRTSGECRLSDFLLFQSTNSILDFVSVTWPEYNGYHFLKSLLLYQSQILLKESQMKPNFCRSDNIRSLSIADQQRNTLISKIREEKWGDVVSCLTIIYDN